MPATETFDPLQAKRREQMPQALARLVVVGLFIVLWFDLWLARMPMPRPFLVVLACEALFFLLYLRAVYWINSVRLINVARDVMLVAEIIFHTIIVYFLGSVSWLGPFAYVFGMIFANTFLDMRRGFLYTVGATSAFAALVLLEATGTVPHYVYMSQGPLRYTNPQFVTTTIVGGFGVFLSIYAWVNWVGSELRQQRDNAVKAQEGLLRARAALEQTNEELEQRVISRTADLELANAALREREANNRALLEAVPDMMLRVQRDGTIVDYKPAHREQRDDQLPDLIGRSVFDFLTGNVGNEARTFIESALETGTPQLYEFPLTVQDGDQRFMEARIVACGDDEVLTLVRNVSERKEAQDALLESEAVLTATIESTADGILVVENSGHVVYANRLFASMWRIPEELIEKRDDDQLLAFVLDQLADPDAFVAKVRELYEKLDEELDILHFKDGRVFERYSLPLLKDGGVVGRVWSFRDITERQRAEDALRESEAKFRTVAETAAAAVFVFQGTKMTYVNPAAQTQTGYSEEELLAMDFWEVIHPEYRELTKKRGMARQAGQEVPLGYEVKLLTKQGEERWVDFTAGVIEYEGKPAVVGTAFDITERKRIEEMLRHQAQRDPLTGVLNHAAIVQELREVLNAGQNGVSHVVVMADLDGLKAINDIYGHQMGDEALIHVARALEQENTVVGRYGGDEFVAVLGGQNRADAEKFRADVVGRLANAQLIDPDTGAFVPIVVSLGFAIHPGEATTVHDLIQVSDSAMYAAKRQRPTGSREATFVRPLGTDRAAELVGQLVPLLTAPGSVNDKLKLVGHRLSVGAGYDAVTFSMFSAQPGELLAENTFARAPEELVDAWHAVESDSPLDAPAQHPVRQVLERTRRPLIIDDPWNDERLYESQREILRVAELRSALVAPLTWEDEVVGLIGVASKRERAFGPSDAQFLATVSNQVTAIIRMATLFDNLKETSSQLQDAREETVRLLASAAEAHDQTTGRHLHNLQDLTEALALELEQPQRDAREMGVAAVLHDIGKIRVPEAVLARPGKLADEEWELMKHHTTWGAQFLAGHPGFELATTIARSHHERWDGRGYPDGLAGEEIPTPATIVAVADAFDAMISDRPYRKARSMAAAVREIEANAGKQFNPAVVDALKRLHKRRQLSFTRREPDEDAA